MQRRLGVRGFAAAAVLATAASITAVAAAPAAPTAAAAAHFVVLGQQGGDLARTQASIEAAGGAVLQSWPQIGVVIATSPSINFAQALRRMPGVAGVGASRALVEFVGAQAASALAGTNRLEQLDGTVDSKAGFAPAAFEPLAPNQWDMRLIRADAANGVSGGSHNLLVGILDSGVDATHPDLAPNIDPANSVGCQVDGVPNTSAAAWAPTTSPHGTHVAGTVAAARNGIGVAGVAPNVRIASVKVVDDGGFIYPEYAICGYIWAAEHGMKVTNNSYFIDPWFKNCLDDPDQRAIVQSVQRALSFSARHDVVTVAATGNSNWDLAHNVTDAGSPDNQTAITRIVGNDCPQLPQEASDVVGVSSVGPTGQKAYYSNYGIGSDTEVTAPGGDRMKTAETPDGNGRVLSTIPGGWGYMQGTSMASPHATGVVALIRSTHPSWSANRAVLALQQQADRLSCPANPYDPSGDGAFLANCQGGSSGRG